MRLIDADALLEKLKKTYKYFDLKFYIDEAPTIDVNKLQTSAEPSIDNGEVSVSDMAGDLVSRQDAIEVGNKIVEELSLSSIDWDDLKHWAKELFDALPSAVPQDNDWSKYSDRLWKLAYERGKADRPKVNSAEWVAEKEKEFEELNTPKFKLELIAEIWRQLRHLDDYVADTCDRPQGEWIFNAYENKDKSWFICSKCGISVFHKSNYCPCCGAKMK